MAPYNPNDAIAAARSQIGVQYAWGGGHGPTPGKTLGTCKWYVGPPYPCVDDKVVGLDCSGLVRYAVYHGSGKSIDLGRGGNTNSQYKDSHSGKIDDAAERAPGDLVFYGTRDNTHHVALYIGNDRMIEARESLKPVMESPLRTANALWLHMFFFKPSTKLKSTDYSYFKSNKAYVGKTIGAQEGRTNVPKDQSTAKNGAAAKPAKTHSFRNWAGNQQANPAQIFHPKTLNDLTEIVHKAKAENMKIRCAATGHTWSSSSVINEDGFLVVVKDMDRISAPVNVGGDVWHVEIETGVTVKNLDDYLRKHDPPLAMACNVGVECIRYGGILSMGSHGAATHTRSLTDLVEAVKIIDASGTMNIFSREVDPVEFSAAALNLGLFGIIYTYTLRVEPMFNLRMRDSFLPLDYYLGSPEIGGPRLKAMVLGNDQTQLFYWPLHAGYKSTKHECLWVKEWHRTDLPVTKSHRRVRFQRLIQAIKTATYYNVVEVMIIFPHLTPKFNPHLCAAVNKNNDQVLHAPNAIHFWGGMEYAPGMALEMAVKVDENFENVVKSWSYVIEQAKRKEFPLNLMVEMRFLKASHMLMSNMYDEDPDAIFATMELVSAVKAKEFEEFSAKLALYWMENHSSRPHWAKMWEHIPGIVPYLQQQSGGRYRKFEEIRRKYDPQGMFMNGTFAKLLGH
ncbi:hypothetical protein EC968_008394 [Mortierella alpina]|nr:hypothetical protein EC968_008394 [Mortierella alpina]